MEARTMLHAFASWSGRRWAAAAVGALLSALAIGLPTRVVPNPWFTRMTPVEWWNYPAWAFSALLAGLLLATYVRSSPAAQSPAPSGVAHLSSCGLLSAFAVGCPVCNKLVVAVLGVSGALSIWAPLQPVLALVSLLLLGVALRQRLANERSCPVATT